MSSKMNITFVSRPVVPGFGINMSREDSLPSYVQIQGLPVPVQLPNNSGGIMDNSSLFTYELGSISPCPWMEGSNITCNFTVHDNSSHTLRVSEESHYTILELVILSTLAGGTCVMTVIGNLIVILSFVIDRAIRQPTNYFILSLAVSDLIIGTFSMPFYTVYLLMGKRWPLGVMLCDIWLSLDYTVCLTSIYTVFCITIDRFCMVSIPAKYRIWRTERKVNTIVAIMWVIPAGLFFTSIIGWQYFVGERTVPPGKCYVQYMEDALFNCVLQIGYFWVTLIVMCILYAGIYKVALGLQRKKAAKQKKMTSLVSMAGQTMTKIGIGMSKQEPVVNQVNKNGKPKASKPHLSPGQARGGSGNTSFSGSGSSRNKPENEERSSSPAYPSDTDPSSQSPKPTGPGTKCEDKPCTTTLLTSTGDANKARSETSNCIGNNVSTTPQYGSTYPNELPTEAILDLPDFPTGDEISDTQITADLSGNYFQFPDPVTTASAISESGAAPATEPPPAYDSLSEAPDSFDKPLPPPPEAADLQCLTVAAATEASPPQTGAHGNNRHHRKSQSNENFAFASESDDLKVDVAILPLRGPDSPIWKKRESFVQREKSASQHFDSLDEDTPAASPKDVAAKQSVPSQKIKRTKHSSLRSRKSVDDDDGGSSQMDTAIHVEPEKNCKSASKTPKVDEIQPLNGGEEGSHKKKRSRGKGSPLKNIVQGISSRRSKRGKKSSDKDKTKEKAEKAKSRSENRARKALRTITIILGAFVLCWTPWHFLAMIIGFCPEGHTCVPDLLYDISYWLCYLNSPINPLCYAFANQQFKKTFLRILKLDWHRT